MELNRIRNDPESRIVFERVIRAKTLQSPFRLAAETNSAGGLCSRRTKEIWIFVDENSE